MENLFLRQLNAMDPEYLKFFQENEEKFKEVQPDVWEFANSIQSVLSTYQSNFTVAEALLVNSIVDFSSYCTSIVAMNSTEVTHVRNLDFDFPSEMQSLVYNQRFVKGGEVIAIAPSIAGFYGIYTTLKPDSYSLSYNVRFSIDHNTTR